MSKNKYLLILVLLGLIGLAYAQHPDTAWVRTYNGPDNYDDYANAIAVDGDGNVYVTGASATIADWPYNSDYATIKYYPDGTIAWTSRYNGPENGNDEAKAIALRSDTVYVTGHSYSDATFDNYCTIKYLPNGDTAWVRTYNGPGNYEDWATAIAVDGSGNVYVTGHGYGSGITADYATIKYLPNGDTAWVRMYDGPGNSGDQANAIAVDGDGNAYVTGTSATNAYSPGSPDDMDYATIKYNSTGDTAVANGGWVRRYTGPGTEDDYGNAIEVDGSGNVYVTGNSGDGTGRYTQDFATIKYTTDGDTTVAAGGWVRRYDGPENENDGAFALALRADTVYVTGQSYRPSVSNDDYATIKYLPNGDTAWVRIYNGPTNNSDYAYAIAVDDAGNVYVTGRSFGSYDPWTGDNYATVKYNSAGVQQWDAIYNGPASGDDRASAIAVAGSGKAAGNVYVTGASATNQYWPPCFDYATIKYSATNAHWTISATVGNHGSIDPSGDVEVAVGTDQSFTITPDSGYQVADVLVDGVSVGAVTEYTFVNVTADHTIHAIFVWIIWADGNYCSIDPSGDVEVMPGADQTFTITPDEGYHVADVLVDGVSVGAVTRYTFVNVTADHTIHATCAGWIQRPESLPTGVSGKYMKAGGAMVSARGQCLYAFRGNKSREFYKFDGSSWAAMCTIPDGYKPPRTDSGKINKRKYPGAGAALCWNGVYYPNPIIYATKGGGTREFWAYDVNGDSWTQKAFIPPTKGIKAGTSLACKDGKIYMLAGSVKKDSPNFYVYTPEADTPFGTPWDTLSRVPLAGDPYRPKAYKAGSCLTILNNTIHALKGGDKQSYFFRYDAPDWTALESIPLYDTVARATTVPAHAAKTKKTKVKDGGAMTNNGNTIYAIKGGGATSLWKYTPDAGWLSSIDDTIPRLNKKSVEKSGAALVYDPGWNKLYLLKGNNTPEFWKYVPSDLEAKVVASVSVTPTTYTSVMAKKTMTTSEFNFAVAPNPFTKLATIRYTVPISGKVTLKLYNAIGRLVETMNDGYLNAGTYTMNLTTRNISSGVYFLRYTDNTNKSEIKLIVQ